MQGQSSRLRQKMNWVSLMSAIYFLPRTDEEQPMAFVTALKSRAAEAK